MPVAQPGAPKCPPFASLCECNKNHYYYYEPSKDQKAAMQSPNASAARVEGTAPASQSDQKRA